MKLQLKLLIVAVFVVAALADLGGHGPSGHGNSPIESIHGGREHGHGHEHGREHSHRNEQDRGHEHGRREHSHGHGHQEHSHGHEHGRHEHSEHGRRHHREHTEHGHHRDDNVNAVPVPPTNLPPAPLETACLLTCVIGQACSDNNPCTSNDTCVATSNGNLCIGLKPKRCEPAPNDCHFSAVWEPDCELNQCRCRYSFKPAGASCRFGHGVCDGEGRCVRRRLAEFLESEHGEHGRHEHGGLAEILGSENGEHGRNEHGEHGRREHGGIAEIFESENGGRREHGRREHGRREHGGLAEIFESENGGRREHGEHGRREHGQHGGIIHIDAVENNGESAAAQP